MDWTDKRVITGWALIAGVLVTLIISITVGAMADNEQTNRLGVAFMIECAKTERTAADCRVMLYGAR